MMNIKHFVCASLAHCGSQVVGAAFVGVNNLRGKCWKFLWLSLCLFICFLNLTTIAPFVNVIGYWSSDAGVVGLRYGWGGVGCIKVLLEHVFGGSLGMSRALDIFLPFQLQLLNFVCHCKLLLTCFCLQNVFKKPLPLNQNCLGGGIYLEIFQFFY